MTFESKFPNINRGGAVFFLVPLLSVIGLGLVMSLTFWIIYQSDLRQSKSLILQDVENSIQVLRLKLRRNEFALNAKHVWQVPVEFEQFGKRDCFARPVQWFFLELGMFSWLFGNGAFRSQISSFFRPSHFAFNL